MAVNYRIMVADIERAERAGWRNQYVSLSAHGWARMLQDGLSPSEARVLVRDAIEATQFLGEHPYAECS